MTLIDRNELRLGMILQARHKALYGRLIRWGQDKWLKRLCRQTGQPFTPCWGNHTALVVCDTLTGSYMIGENAPAGGIVTSIHEYEERVNGGVCQIRFYEPTDVSEKDMRQAAANWLNRMKGAGYDWIAYPRLIVKTAVMDLSESRWAWLRKIGDRAAGKEWDRWCTEGAADAYLYNPPKIDIFQRRNPIPLTVEQVAGELPRKPGKKVTLRNVTERIVKSD